jgi:hypothetical protein
MQGLNHVQAKKGQVRQEDHIYTSHHSYAGELDGILPNRLTARLTNFGAGGNRGSRRRRAHIEHKITEF